MLLGEPEDVDVAATLVRATDRPQYDSEPDRHGDEQRQAAYAESLVEHVPPLVATPVGHIVKTFPFRRNSPDGLNQPYDSRIPGLGVRR